MCDIPCFRGGLRRGRYTKFEVNQTNLKWVIRSGPRGVPIKSSVVHTSQNIGIRVKYFKLICSTFHPWCCSVTPRARLRDTYWSSVRDRARVRHSDIGPWRHSCTWIPRCTEYPQLFWWAAGTLGHPVSVSKILFEPLIPLFDLPLLDSVLIVWRGVWSHVPLLCSRWSPPWHSVIGVLSQTPL